MKAIASFVSTGRGSFQNFVISNSVKINVTIADQRMMKLLLFGRSSKKSWRACKLLPWPVLNFTTYSQHTLKQAEKGTLS
jgi:hypothetical protein